MAANKIDTYFFGHAHTPTHTCLITKEKTSLPIPLHSLNQGKQQKNLANTTTTTTTCIVRSTPGTQLISFRHDLERRDAGKAASKGDMSAFFSCIKLILGFIFN
jgi:hypothetical protein